MFGRGSKIAPPLFISPFFIGDVTILILSVIQLLLNRAFRED